MQFYTLKYTFYVPSLEKYLRRLIIVNETKGFLTLFIH